METFSKLSSLLLSALEMRAPTVDLLESFVDHWKSITNYYIQTTDDSRPVRQTEIPWCLRQMLDILVYEEKQQVEDTGPCLEYLLQHKLLETLCTLGKAQYPPGMIQQVLLFFSKLLSQIQKPLLQLIAVYRPVQKLIGLCAFPGSHTEKEEAQFLFVVCSSVKQDPHTLRYLLQVTVAARTPASDQSQPCTPASNHSKEPLLPPSQSDSSTHSPVQSESGLLSALLQLAQSQRASVCLKAFESLLLLSALQSESSGELLADHTQLGELLTGRLLQLYALLPLESLDAGELQSWPHTPWRCEQVVLVSTSILCVAVRLVKSWSLLDQLVHFLLRTPPLPELLLQRCDHISDQISLASLCLVEELLQKPHRDILEVLVVTFLQSRSYLSAPAAGQEDTPLQSNQANEESDDLEEDPFFSDSLLFSDSLPPPPLSSASSSAAPPSGLGSAADVVNSLPSSSGEGEEFFEGHLLKVLFDRLGRVLEQPYELNLKLTAVLSRLSAFNHPLLQEYLLDPYIHLSHCSRSLFSVLIRLMGELMQRVQLVSNLTDRLLNTRRDLLGLNHNIELEHLTLLRGLVVLEEFCKELAAIAFVKLPKDQVATPLDQQGLAWTSSDSPGPAVTP
ncbi:Protein FAM160B2 [Liparis tanakae]|uniref:Protein FAM160B2 n=1 Tax=Liparis tanakae TaxID=230148 RepID=A0A4Z2GR20_9TELE|nr:Protein FAM160B2 [Liparis tanakae]